jgi:hypothetical protein
MTDVQTLIDAPGSRDFKVCEVITDDMMGEVIQALTGHGCNGVEDLMHVWRTEYKERYAISGFLKDKAIGSKRLISMPDRISNTINSEGLVLMRPSVISMFNDVGMKTTAGWWALWKQYMFHTQVILSLPPSFPCRVLSAFALRRTSSTRLRLRICTSGGLARRREVDQTHRSC